MVRHWRRLVMSQQQSGELWQIEAIVQLGRHRPATGFQHADPHQELHSLPLGIGSQARLLLQPPLRLEKPPLLIRQSA
jgi:hypothetical protein